MSDVLYNSFKHKVLDGSIDMDTHAFKMALLDESYVPSADHVGYADLSGEVPDGNGYTTGGKALTGVTLTSAGGTTTWDADDVSWPASTFSAAFGVIYDDTASGKPLVKCFDFGGTKYPYNGDFSIIFNASGILTLT